MLTCAGCFDARRTPVLLIDAPAGNKWPAFERWAEPGYLERKIAEPIKFAKSYTPTFLYFSKLHAWATQARETGVQPGERLGPEHGNWLVPAQDIKMTLATFHRESNASAWGGGGEAGKLPPSFCATENQPCDCPPGGRVRYGAAPNWSKWRKMRKTEEFVICGNKIFGDPSPGAGKSCQCKLPPAAAVPPPRSKPRWVYHSKCIAGQATKQDPWVPVMDDIDVTRTADFWVPPPHPQASESRDGPIVHLWYGSAGSSTRSHFDYYENFFVQVLGHKRWLLASPEHYAEMYVLPHGHPSGRQSALDWPHNDTAVFPRASKHVRLLEAYIGPKEVLYVPPVWFHSTEAIGPGPNLGLSYWSESETQTNYNELATHVNSHCKGGPRVRSARQKRQLLRNLGEIVAVSLNINDVGSAAVRGGSGGGIFTPTLIAELIRLSARFAHNSPEFPLRPPYGVAPAIGGGGYACQLLDSNSCTA